MNVRLSGGRGAGIVGGGNHKADRLKENPVSGKCDSRLKINLDSGSIFGGGEGKPAEGAIVPVRAVGMSAVMSLDSVSASEQQSGYQQRHQESDDSVSQCQFAFHPE
jgi:hypothetical protein